MKGSFRFGSHGHVDPHTTKKMDETVEFQLPNSHGQEGVHIAASASMVAIWRPQTKVVLWRRNKVGGHRYEQICLPDKTQCKAYGELDDGRYNDQEWLSRTMLAFDGEDVLLCGNPLTMRLHVVDVTETPAQMCGSFPLPGRECFRTAQRMSLCAAGGKVIVVAEKWFWVYQAHRGRYVCLLPKVRWIHDCRVLCKFASPSSALSHDGADVALVVVVGVSVKRLCYALVVHDAVTGALKAEHVFAEDMRTVGVTASDHGTWIVRRSGRYHARRISLTEWSRDLTRRWDWITLGRTEDNGWMMLSSEPDVGFRSHVGEHRDGATVADGKNDDGEYVDGAEGDGEYGDGEYADVAEADDEHAAGEYDGDEYAAGYEYADGAEADGAAAAGDEYADAHNAAADGEYAEADGEYDDGWGNLRLVRDADGHQHMDLYGRAEDLEYILYDLEDSVSVAAAAPGGYLAVFHSNEGGDVVSMMRCPEVMSEHCFAWLGAVARGAVARGAVARSAVARGAVATGAVARGAVE